MQGQIRDLALVIGYPPTMSKLKEILTYRISDTELPKYKVSEFPKFALGAAIIGGGVYGIVKLMLRKKDEEEMTVLTELHKDKLAAPKLVPAIARGEYSVARHTAHRCPRSRALWPGIGDP